MRFFPQSALSDAHWSASSQVNTAVFLHCADSRPLQEHSPCSHKSEVKVALKWNFTFAVRNHLRTLDSRLKKRLFQSCHFARQGWAVSTQTPLYPAGPALYPECILLYLFTHFHLDKRCEEWETEQLFLPDKISLTRSDLRRPRVTFLILKARVPLPSSLTVPKRQSPNPTGLPSLLLRQDHGNCCFAWRDPFPSRGGGYGPSSSSKNCWAFISKLSYWIWCGFICSFCWNACVLVRDGKEHYMGEMTSGTPSIRAWPFIKQAINCLWKWKRTKHSQTDCSVSLT